MSDSDDFLPVGPLLGGVLRRLGIPDAKALTRLEAGWQAALGPAGPHARLVRIEATQLTIEVDHAVWITRVRMCRPALEELLGEPVRLEVRVRR